MCFSLVHHKRRLCVETRLAASRLQVLRLVWLDALHRSVRRALAEQVATLTLDNWNFKFAEATADIKYEHGFNVTPTLRLSRLSRARDADVDCGRRARGRDVVPSEESVIERTFNLTQKNMSDSS